MNTRQSDVLLVKIREALGRRGWNTAALAEAMGEDRKRIRAVLAGREPLTVDDFGRMVQVLEISPGELGIHVEAGGVVAEGETGGSVDEVPPGGSGDGSGVPLGVVKETPAEEDEAWTVDPYGPQAEQLFRMGFGLGIDIHFMADTTELRESGVPGAVLARFPKQMPITLPAAYHRHMKPRFHEDGIELQLSFDRLYGCFFPWSAIQQVTFFPERQPVATKPPEPAPGGRPVLTLVKS